jgi:biotin carboxylase
MMKNKQGLEITTFKLKGHTCKEFITANADIDEWLKAQPGFQSRWIAEQVDGTIVDMLIWDSVRAGTDAMQRIMTEMGHSAVHDMIDQGTVSWSCIPVKHQVC